MASSRTTSALIRSAIEAANKAGLTIGAVEVAPGGVVRILPITALPSHPAAQEGNTCDHLFGEASDCGG